jgi:hypothetical protein
VKSDALRRLRQERADVDVVGTTNAETNAAILAINRRLGFKSVAVFTICALPQPEPDRSQERDGDFSEGDAAFLSVLALDR